MSRARRARGAGWAWPALVWIVATALVGATVLLQVVVRPQLASDPLVGGGRLDAPASAQVPGAVLPGLSAPSASVDAAALARTLEALPRDGLGDLAGLVVDAETGTELYRVGSGARTPASSMKVLSGVVALDVLGADTRFETRTYLTADGQVILRGGGDPLLASAHQDAYPHAASLEDLAASTAEALRARGVTSVELGYDASLFGGPAWNPHWPETFATSVAPITALTVDHARPDANSWARSTDPARLAADAFASRLAAQGIAVTEVEAEATPAEAQQVAAVASPPVGVLVEHTLSESDNDAAETLLWQVALARGKTPNPDVSAATLITELTRLGLWSDGMVAHDGNGISADNQVTPDALVGAVRLAVQRPALRHLLTGLPVAGVSGTLDERFDAADSLAGRGLVRAKTGTIRGVNTLTGYVVTADGQPLVFAFMTSGGAGQTSARAWLDRASSALASCGC